MTYLFVGSHSETLASGRPLVFGDTVEPEAVTEADERLRPLLVDHTPSEAPAPEPEPEPTTPEAS